MKRIRFVLIAATGMACLALLAVPAANFYYRSSWGGGCARCHEVRPNYDVWQSSTHRKVNCTDCHASSLATNARRVVTHLRGRVPERVRLGLNDVFEMTERCRGCHQQEYAQWRTGPHGSTYSRFFTNSTHNRKRLLMDECLHCHGMHFPGGIGDVVEPIETKGPWMLKDVTLVNRPAIPCLACHSMHHEGEPMSKADSRTGSSQEIFRPSLSLYDRRSQMSLALAYLPVPEVVDASRAVRMSPDRRQALCYQCHAPLASRQVRSGDDRTPVGVHEGLGCLACHQKHGLLTRASCAGCHPRLSNCGRDVERMDTTFVYSNSKNDIHSVRCLDCHPKGVPAKRKRTTTPGDQERAVDQRLGVNCAISESLRRSRPGRTASR